MKRKEIIEIKKQFTPAACAITRIAGCVVNDGDIESVFNRPFLNLPEEEIFKYFDILRKGLSGKKGKNLYSLEFKADTGERTFMKSILDSRLREEMGYEIFMENIAEYAKSTEQFAVFIIHAAYDIPGKALDGTEMEDASDEVYEYIMTCICPVSLSRPGLSWNREIGEIVNAPREWMVGMPTTAFVYPAFTDRSADYDHVWLYTKKADDPDEGIISNVLGCHMPVTFAEQRDAFYDTIKPGTFSIYEMERVKELLRNLAIMAENQNESDEDIKTDELLSVLRAAGIDTEGAGDQSGVVLKNIINMNRLEIDTADVHISASAERGDLVDIREIDGEQCIVVKAGGVVSANGIHIGEE